MSSIQIRPLSFTLVALAALSGCGTPPAGNVQLDEARRDYQAARDNPQARELAGSELGEAGETLARADAALARRDSAAQVDHLAYMARQQVAIARETGRQKAAEQEVAHATAARDQIRLEARTREADAAQLGAQAARRQSEESSQQADMARRQAQAAQEQAGAARERTALAEARLRELDARPTDRGLVITIGDMLFDTGRARLKPGSMRQIGKLADFLKQYPQRRALVEGFTDSVGSDSRNEDLSSRRAEAVRTALVGQGVQHDRVDVHGYGEAYPVAGNDSSGGRQMNRRVEILLSDENGTITPR